MEHHLMIIRTYLNLPTLNHTVVEVFSGPFSVNAIGKSDKSKALEVFKKCNYNYMQDSTMTRPWNGRLHNSEMAGPNDLKLWFSVENDKQ